MIVSFPVYIQRCKMSPRFGNYASVCQRMKQTFANTNHFFMPESHCTTSVCFVKVNLRSVLMHITYYLQSTFRTKPGNTGMELKTKRNRRVLINLQAYLIKS